MNAEAFVQEIESSESQIKLFIVGETEIKQMETKIKQASPKTVPGTMRTHQVLTVSPGEIQYRDVSCSCFANTCPDHSLQSFTFIIPVSCEDNIGKSAEQAKPARGAVDADQNVEQGSEISEVVKQGSGNSFPAENVGTCYSGATEKDTENNDMGTENRSGKNVLEPVMCIPKPNAYVVVSYENKPYPGIVEKVNKDEVYVECMRKVGRKNDNCFYWPKRGKDKCWYDLDKIISIIPEPKLKMDSTSHYEMDPEHWRFILQSISEEK